MITAIGFAVFLFQSKFGKETTSTSIVYCIAIIIALLQYGILFFLQEAGSPLMPYGITYDLFSAQIGAVVVCGVFAFGAARWMFPAYAVLMVFWNSFYFMLVPFPDPRAVITMNIIFIMAGTLMYLLERKEYRIFSSSYELEQSKKALFEKNKEAVRLNEYLNSFFHAVSHELKTPLRTATSFHQLMLRTIDENRSEHEVEVYSRFVEDAHVKMRVLIDSLVAFSNLEDYEIHSDDVDLQSVFQEALQRQMSRIETEKKVSFTFSKNIPHVQADQHLMEMLADQLVSNAVKYAAHNRPVHMEMDAHEENGKTVFTFRDNGIGFEPGFERRIFRLFTRLHNDSNYKGAGVGLAIADRIVQLHQGRIWADGKSGQGAAFHFEI